MEIFEHKREIANNQDGNDYLITNGKIIPSLSKYVYEHKYTLKDINAIKKLLKNESHIQQMKDFIKKTEIPYATCRFDFKDMDNIPLSLQQDLLHFQEKIYSDVTVQLIKNDFNSFRQLMTYAKNKIKLPCVSLVDIKINYRDIKTALDILKEADVSYSKWLYGKFTTYIQNYVTIRNSLQELTKTYILTGCNKRCGIAQYNSIAVSLIAVKQYGFTACCRNYVDTSDRKKKGFPLGADIFSRNLWAWELDINKDYQKKRQNNLINLNMELDNLIPSEISKRPSFDKLIVQLVKLEKKM